MVPHLEFEQNESSLNSESRDITALSHHNAEAAAALEMEPRLLPIEDEWSTCSIVQARSVKCLKDWPK